MSLYAISQLLAERMYAPVSRVSTLHETDLDGGGVLALRGRCPDGFSRTSRFLGFRF